MTNYIFSWENNVNMQTAGSPGGPPPGEGTPPPPPGDMGGEGMHTPHEPGDGTPPPPPGARGHSQ